MRSRGQVPFSLSWMVGLVWATCVVYAQSTILPHFTYRDAQWNTQLSVYVPGPDDQQVTVRAYDNTGMLNASNDVRINGLTGFFGTVHDLLPDLTADVGWLEFSAQGDQLEGIMKFSYLPTGGTSSLPLTREVSQRWALLLMENDNDWASGFVVTNTGDQRAEVTLTLLAFDGTPVDVHALSLAPHAKHVAMLSDVFPSSLPDHAILEIESSVDVAAFALTFQADMQQIVAVPGAALSPIPMTAQDRLLNDTFRIDIRTIEVDFEFLPAQAILEADARVTFRMRPDQSLPLVHLDEPIIQNHLDEVWLNGESLDPDNPADVKLVSFADSWQRGFEMQRVLAPHVDHVLEMRYQVPVGYSVPSLYTDCNDITGHGNEAFFPTINSPAELARHVLRFRVAGSTQYVFIGSGWVVEESVEDGQSWLLDTEEEVASYTVMWVMMPRTVAQVESRTIDGVDVRIMSFIGGASRDPAFDSLETWLPELRENLGPFPMNRGLSIFLTNGGGGMEYFGGTMTSLWALDHEVFHMYFGCSVVAKTYRDSWWDEAINIWYEDSAIPGALQPIAESYQSNIVSGRTPITPGFDTRAYDEGAQIMQAVAQELGGRQEMIAFLAYLVAHYTFKPFTTPDFLDYLEDYAGLDMRTEFQQWLYQGGAMEPTKRQPPRFVLPVDMSPPVAMPTP